MAADVAQPAQSNKVATYVNEVTNEMRRVTWPDRAQLQDTTIKIIIFVLFIGALIGVIDVILQAILVRGIPALFLGGR